MGAQSRSPFRPPTVAASPGSFRAEPLPGSRYSCACCPVLFGDRNSGRHDASGGAAGHGLLGEELSEGSLILGLGHRGLPIVVGRRYTVEEITKGFPLFYGNAEQLPPASLGGTDKLAPL